MQTRNKRNNFRVCSGPHSISTCSGYPTEEATAHVSRRLGHKYLSAEINGKKFPNSDAAFEAIRLQGYGSEYFRRHSDCGKRDLDFLQAAARFDAKYRFYKWLQRQMEKNKGNSNLQYLFWREWSYIYGELKKLAEKVSIFHPCTKHFNPDYPIEYKIFNCKKCGEKFKSIFPYRGRACCPKCEAITP